jgi:aspartate aminotransferase/aromatic-amino-acid transaminase
MMFEKLDMAPADPILGLEEAFKRDANPQKINLSVGVYKDAEGTTPIFHTVKLAEVRLLEEETSKSYLGIAGSPEYAAAVQELIFGPQHEVIAGQRAVTAQTPGGTGGLRVAGDFLKKINPGARIWVSQPTWPNHNGVFKAAGLTVETYPYFDAGSNQLAFEAMLATLQQAPAGDVIVLHGSCHNPTGIDPTPEQWARITQVLKERNLFPLVDFAYQGLGEGIREDAQGVLTLCGAGLEMLIASSFSKNFGLYNERVGALTLVAASAAAAATAFSHLKICIRANYSNPPAHGAKIVTTILQSPELRAEWETEVAAIRERIRHMRRRFVEELRAQGVKQDFSFIQRQHGMFSFTGLTPAQVQTLREQYSVYLVETGGRINVAGMTEANLPSLCRAIAAIL